VSKSETLVEVGGQRLKLTNLDKVMYAATGLTKGGVIDYYVRVSEFMLPHLAGRPITLKRYPGGVDGEFFYQKNCPVPHPSWIATTSVEAKAGALSLCVIDTLPGLVWIANLASLEVHAYLALARRPKYPSYIAFDLDPGAPAGLLEAAAVAARLRTLLRDLGLRCFAKVSGGKGLHVYVPLNTPTGFEKAKSFARAIAMTLERDHPRGVTSNMRKDLRHGKVLVDWSQNDPHKTTVCVYSLRARERPTVSMPVEWDELDAAVKARTPKRLHFDSDQAVARVQRLGDLFGPVMQLKQTLPSSRALEASASR
jgi:bifunctional non-homologous end joining protein LigD